MKIEKKYLYLTVAVLIISTLTMISVLAGFITIKDAALRSLIQLFAYIFGFICYIILVIRQYISGKGFRLYLYIAITLLILFILITHIYKNFDLIAAALRKMI